MIQVAGDQPGVQPKFVAVGKEDKKKENTEKNNNVTALQRNCTLR